MNNLVTENNYVYIPGFISPEAAKTLSENFTKFCEDNKITGDIQVPESSSSYNYIDFLELLCNSTPAVGEFIGETVLPTYTYARVYNKGSDLKIHKDRDACEISLTVHLDGDQEWPIYIKNPKGETISLNLKSGDAMLYLGCEAEHWRDEYIGEKYVQVFLHYVKSRGDRAYAFFDKQREKPQANNDAIAEVAKISNERNDKILLPDTSSNHIIPLKQAGDSSEEVIETKNSDNINSIHRISSENKVSDFIKVFDNIVPESICDEIIREYDTEFLHMARAGKNSELMTDARRVLMVRMKDLNTLCKSDDNYIIRKKLDETIHHCMFEVLKKYTSIFPSVEIEGDSGFDFLKYRVGDFYIEHIDSFTQVPRTLSVSVALNDDYEGGEFAFFNREIKYSLKKGSVIVFPSAFMFPHEILPVTKGTRYAIITWMR